MRVDVVLITTGSRPQLLVQSLRSLHENSTRWEDHTLTVVMDGDSVMNTCLEAGVVPNRIIVSPERQGASRSRNVGAGSTPKYLRKDALMVLDDDVYCAKGWDAFNYKPDAVWSSHAHPYNLPLGGRDPEVPAEQTSVISTVHMIIPWDIWDAVGPFAEPGGPGGSEDVDWCARAAKLGYTFGITTPQAILHTGVTSSSSKPIVGAELVQANNQRLEKVHAIEEKVQYA